MKSRSILIALVVLLGIGHRSLYGQSAIRAYSVEGIDPFFTRGFSNQKNALTRVNTPDGSGYLYAGNGLMKVDASGKLLWQKSFSGSEGPLAIYGAYALADGGVILLLGVRFDDVILPSYNDIPLVHLSPDGVEVARTVIESPDFTVAIDRRLYPLDSGCFAIMSNPFGMMIVMDSTLAIKRTHWFKQYAYNLGIGSVLAKHGDTLTLLLTGARTEDSGFVAVATVTSIGQLLSCKGFVIAEQSFLPPKVLHTVSGDTYVALERSSSFNEVGACLLLKLDTALELNWCTAFNQPLTGGSASLIEGDNGEIILVRSESSGSDLSVIDSSGTVNAAYTIREPHPGSGSHTITRDKNGIQLAGLYDDSVFYSTTISLVANSCLLKPTLVNVAPRPILTTFAEHLTEIFPLTIDSLTWDLFSIDHPVPPATDLCEALDVTEPITLSPNIYPNPVAARAMLTLRPGTIKAGAYQLSLRSPIGTTVFHSSLSVGFAQEIRIPTAGLASGLYIVELTDASSFAVVWHSSVIVE